MTTTEEIVVSGKNFIERRIFVCPRPRDLEDLKDQAYACGYNYGWGSGLLAGLGLCAAALFIWLVLHG